MTFVADPNDGVITDVGVGHFGSGGIVSTTFMTSLWHLMGTRGRCHLVV